jgi:hypothetical protein
MAFSEEALLEINTAHQKIHAKCAELFGRYFLLPLKNARAREFARQGFARRLQIMVHCIDKVFELVPPNIIDKPTRPDLIDITINIQAFMINVFGAIDNLAWIWVSEKNLKMPSGRPISGARIGLGPKYCEVRESFSPPFQDFLRKLDGWFDGMGDYRNALAHRISPYVPPYTVTNDNQSAYMELIRSMNVAMSEKDFETVERLVGELDRLGKFNPWLQHSFEEEAIPIYFHPQLLADFNTVESIGSRLIDEL